MPHTGSCPRRSGPRANRAAGSFVVALTGVLLSTAAASAQSSTTRGLSLALHLQGSSISVEGGDAANGGGAGLRVGYGINRIVTLFARADGSQTDIDDASVEGQWTLAHGEVGARFHFANSLRRWVPFLEAAVGGRAVEVDGAVVEGEAEGATVTFSGGAFSLGGGMGVHFNESLALDVGLVWSSGEFDEIEVGNVTVGGFDIDARTFRFNLGLVWWP